MMKSVLTIIWKTPTTNITILFWPALYSRNISKEGVPECQKSWWGQAYVVGIICPVDKWCSGAHFMSFLFYLYCRKLLSKLVGTGPQVLIRSGGPGFHKLLQQGRKERSFPKESLEDEKTILKAGTLFFKIICTSFPQALFTTYLNGLCFKFAIEP